MPSARSRNIAPRRALTDLPVYIIQGKTDAYFNSTSDCRPHRTAREYSKIAYDALSEKAPIHVLNTYPG